MRNTIYRIIYAFVLFCVSFVLMEVFSKGSSTQTTTKMSGAVLPVVSMDTGSTVFNALYGMTGDQDPGKMRPVLTPIASDRTIRIRISRYNTELLSASAEVRDVTGQRLIEKQDVEIQDAGEGTSTGVLSFTNLVQPDTEYMLVLLLSTEDAENIRYYTRFYYSADSGDQEEAEAAIAFAETFHEKTFDKTADDFLLTYLEPDDSVSGSSLSKVTLYSSADQVTWGDLSPSEVTKPVFSLTDYQSGIYGIRGTYYVASQTEEGKQKLYRCEEYYELRMGTDRFYLMDFERTVSEDFDPQNPEGEDGYLQLGIADKNTDVTQSKKRSVTAFVHDGRLYEVSLSEDLLVYIFGFDEAGDTGERETRADHGIRILDVMEDGSVDFLVYGYMNCGRHEGKMGVSFYHYSGEYHTLEEKVFVPYDGSWDLLNNLVGKLSYYDRDKGSLYLFLYDTLYEVNVNSCSIRKLESNLASRRFVISKSGEMIAMEEMTEGEPSGAILLVNLNGQVQSRLEAPSGKRAIPLGFLGEDLVYGTAASRDLITDASGITVEPMDHIYIVDPEQNVLEDYHQDGYYVLSCEVRESQLVLTRVQKAQDGEASYVPASDDEILSGATEDKTALVRTKSSAASGMVVQIQTGESDWESCHYIRPQEILYEGSRELLPRGTTEEKDADSGIQSTHCYYVYSSKEFLGCEYDLTSAIETGGAERSGVVVNEQGRYLWRKRRPERSEIDALTSMEEGTALLDSREMCLKAILSAENISADAAGLLDQGKTSLEILQEELKDYEVLNLFGCSLDEVLYYVGIHQAVYAETDGGETILIIGYGPENIEIYDPAAGSVHLMNLETARENFAAAGNRFLSYIPAG